MSWIVLPPAQALPSSGKALISSRPVQTRRALHAEGRSFIYEGLLVEDIPNPCTDLAWPLLPEGASITHIVRVNIPETRSERHSTGHTCWCLYRPLYQHLSFSQSNVSDDLELVTS